MYMLVKYKNDMGEFYAMGCGEYYCCSLRPIKFDSGLYVSTVKLSFTAR